MKASKTSLQVTKLISAWNRPLKADFKKLFIALTKAVAHGLTGNWLGLTGDATEALKAVRLEKDPGQLAWALIRNALAHAIFDLAIENTDTLSRHKQKTPTKFCKELDFSIENIELTIDRSFFDRPMDLPLIENIKKPFIQWLVGHGLPEARAMVISERLPSYFVFSLNDEWRRNSKHYIPIKDKLETPFTRASEKEQAWIRYNAWLIKQIDESILSETFGLRQVYVPLRAYYVQRRKNRTKKEKQGFDRAIKREREGQLVVVDLEDELIKWLKKEDKSDAIRVISGGPGCGKSAFSKMFSARLAELGFIKVVYIPLYQFDPKDDLIESIGHFVQQTELFRHNPADSKEGEKRLLIIFDGLDELAMQGKVGAEVAKRFVEEIDRTIRRRNLQELHLQLLISGRQLIVQATEDEFRKEAQILNILPYYLDKKRRKIYEDTKGLLQEDQRKTWWKQYGNATGYNYTGIPRELKRKELDELTSQPLLNYLVAFSVTRSKLDFTADINLNQIYQDLIEAVYERGYERGRLYRPIHHMNKEDFIRILEEVALSTWHGDGRTTTVSEIHDHCRISGLLPLFNVFQDGAKSGVTSLLSAFYFRRKGMRHNGEQTFEFTHKSFGEYLTARRIIHGMDCMVNERQRKQKDPFTGWDEKVCLKHWAELCGPTSLDKYLFDFISRELHLYNKNNVENCQGMISQLMGFMLKNGLPMDQLGRKLDYIDQTEQARNAQEALIVVLNSCARITHRVSKIEWPEPISAGVLLALLSGQRAGSENVMALNCLSYLDLSKCFLDMRDLYRANLEYASLYQASMVLTTLFMARLNNANLKKAQMVAANLTFADLEKAKLQGVNLRSAILDFADFRGANLQKAQFIDASLRKANFNGADLSGENLEGANLEDAYFGGANFEKVNFAGANLESTYFDSANLKNTKNLTAKQLFKVGTLYKAKLDRDLKEKIEKERPEIFKKPVKEDIL